MFLPAECCHNVENIYIKTKDCIYKLDGEEAQAWINRAILFNERLSEDHVMMKLDDKIYEWHEHRNIRQWFSGKMVRLHLLGRSGYQKTPDSASLLQV